MIGLVMIVKNESAVIRRCLESALPLIDHWTVVDTGSEDDTASIVRDALRHVPGQLHERPWVNFGHNLTEALSLARGTADWLLRLDADMTVEAHPGLRSWLAGNPCPHVEAWLVELRQESSYRLPMLVSGARDWKYVGATHEYLDIDHDRTQALTGLTLKHHSDGSNRKEKFARDLALLEGEDARSVFYRAVSLEGLGRTEEAVACYQRRSEMGGFEEEAWYAEYMAAKLSKNIAGLLKAYCRRPHRHEPLTAARKLVGTLPNNDVLFREPL